MKASIISFRSLQGSVLSLLVTSFPVTAQVTPDKTLPTNSIATPQGNSINIEGGTIKGGNLFHSFDQFSIPQNSTVIFKNATSIQNIFSRVTGKSISNIDGILKTNGTANLFLINPNGIIFGQNAQLNTGGSFVASTANAVRFVDGSEFSAKNPQAQPLLTVTTPLGLQVGSNSGVILAQGTDRGLTTPSSRRTPSVRNTDKTGLAVQPGKTLALLGSSLSLEGANLTAEGGRIELGAVADGTVNFTLVSQGISLNYQDVQRFGNVNLSQQALVDASGNLGGSVTVKGKNISFSDGAAFLIQNQGTQPSGSINVSATNLITLRGISLNDGRFTSLLQTESTGSGSAGNINIFAPKLLIQEGAGISSRAYSNGRGGNIIVNAPESTQLLDFSSFNPLTTSGITSLTLASGNAGDVTISTGHLEARNGGGITSQTLGKGKAGDVTVNAAKSIEVTNTAELINSPEVRLQSRITSTTFNAGNAGNLTINTPSLTVSDSSTLNTSSVGSGSAGNVIINADDVELKSGRVSSAVVNADQETQKISGAPSVASGSSGEVVFNTKNLRMYDGIISGRNLGTGEGGTITINGNLISLDKKSSITAATASGRSGNIFMNAQNLQLRNDSAISATAGGNGDGGNVTINTNILIGSKNSSITANAFEGIGGNILINTKGLFFSPDSKITASSERGINGTVEINVFNKDPNRTKATPEVVVETPKIASACQGGSGAIASRFVITGKGGLPASPDEKLYSNSGWQRDSVPIQATENLSKSKLFPDNNALQIVEAQGWVEDSNGNVVLIAEANTGTSYASLSTGTCHTQYSGQF
ncbi:filamentous hemagglutinin N-terminal domain-containing protein [Komarekiella sp. 'clone 1']|uniref:Filamentous hemagglutinin N-terminal domain-containing protein n=1 Tax=Komarekiella delphini-convector SJRDD-AB1 TaxID=2593771 RepID=A0AA40VVB2_9NOST|nr:filamentous hemagglutinin N-terminal domain-containing protein [Komarekiella delphini-convector]MBD6620939.1 filamentous hemagglutinin N-terminal domain-containing protein [Komarekiella delphini-convector SJRDD-AB1]